MSVIKGWKFPVQIDKKTGRFKQTAKLFLKLKINLDIANKLQSLRIIKFPYFAPKILEKF